VLRSRISRYSLWLILFLYLLALEGTFDSCGWFEKCKSRGLYARRGRLYLRKLAENWVIKELGADYDCGGLRPSKACRKASTWIERIGGWNVRDVCRSLVHGVFLRPRWAVEVVRLPQRDTPIFSTTSASTTQGRIGKCW